MTTTAKDNPFTSTNRALTWLKKQGRVSERALASEFAEQLDDYWRYDADAKEWRQWCGTHWARRQSLEFLDAVGHFAAAVAEVFCRLEQITHTEAVKLQSQRTAAGIERICRGLPSFLARSALFDADPWLLGTPGGTVELKTGKLRPARPEDYITMLTRITPAENEDCPRWLRFIDEVTSGDKEIGEFLRQWGGLNLCGDPFHQRLAFMYGTGRNGKNTWADTMLAILGDYGYMTNFDAFVSTYFAQHSTDVWALRDKRMVVASEVPDGAVWNSQRLKDLTGNATITARGMRRDNETFSRTFTISLLSNNRPKLKNTDVAIRSRLRTVAFDRDFEAEGLADPQLPKKLLEEAPGILRWGINGLLTVLQAHGKIIEPTRVTEDTEDYLNQYDLRRQFVATRIEEDKEAPETPVHDFYEAWKAFAEWKDIDPLNERSLSVWLVKLTGAERGERTDTTKNGKKTERVATLKGIKLKSVFGT